LVIEALEDIDDGDDTVTGKCGECYQSEINQIVLFRLKPAAAAQRP
jgi:hypothetical protein